MCGIAGVVRFDGLNDVDRNALRNALTRLAHRGPDGEAVRDDGVAALGHRRLAIIDPEGGTQPIGNENGSIWVTANCEIYNHQTLRTDLQARGHQFQTRCDAEVIVHLYEEFGDAFTSKLRGMYAFAIWDAPRRRLTLARDPFGIKPLYLSHCKRHVLFASRLDAVIQHPDVHRHIDPKAIVEFLTLHYIPSPRTILNDVRKLEPGQRIVITPDTCAATNEANLSFQNHPTMSEAQWEQRIRERLAESVQTHLLADVPVGALLSGGLDSSAVVWNMAGILGPQFDVFTAGFKHPTFDERDDATRLARRLGLPHHVDVFEPDPVSTLETISATFDEPFADPSAIATWAISKLASQHVKTVLSGDGGDELFAGYTRYLRRFPQSRTQSTPKSTPTLNAIGHLGAHLHGRHHRFNRLAAAMDGFAAAGDDAHCLDVAWYHPWDTAALLRPETHRLTDHHDPFQTLRRHFNQCDAETPLERSQYVDIKTWLADGVLCKVDRASMAHGLEVRVPLLDTQWAESIIGLPATLKINHRRGKHRRGKHIFRQALRPQLGDDIVNRRKKGFVPPLAQWCRGPLAEIARDAILAPNANINNWLDPTAVRRCWTRFHSHAEDRLAPRIWAILMLESWLKRHNANPTADPQPTLESVA